MKVTIYDDKGEVIGIAWHENNAGYVELPPATRECVAVSYAINDGPVQPLAFAVQVPVDETFKMRVRDTSKPPPDYFERLMKEAFGPRDEDLVDKPSTGVTWWQKLKGWFT